MNNGEIVAIVAAYTAQKESLAKARQEGQIVEELKLPADIAWKRRVNLDKLFKAKELIDNAIQEVQENYSDNEHSSEVETPDGKTARVVKPEYFTTFVNEQKDIYSQDTEVDIKKIKIGDLGSIHLTDEMMDTLAFMIEE